MNCRGYSLNSATVRFHKEYCIGLGNRADRRIQIHECLYSTLLNFKSKSQLVLSEQKHLELSASRVYSAAYPKWHICLPQSVHHALLWTITLFSNSTSVFFSSSRIVSRFNGELVKLGSADIFLDSLSVSARIDKKPLSPPLWKSISIDAGEFCIPCCVNHIEGPVSTAVEQHCKGI